MARTGEGFGLACDFIIDHTIASVNVRAAQSFLGFVVILGLCWRFKL